MPLTNVFLATDEEIARTLRGWKRAATLLPDFVERTVVNPFTREQLTIRTLVSDEQPEPDPDAVIDPALDLPFLDQKGLDVLQIVFLGRVLLGWDQDRANSEILGRFVHGPLDAEVSVVELPPSLVLHLAALPPESIAGDGRRWAEVCLADYATVPGEAVRRALLTTPPETWISRLGDIAALAREARGRGLYLWMTP